MKPRAPVGRGTRRRCWPSANRLRQGRDEHTQAIRTPIGRDGEDALDVATDRAERETLLAEIRFADVELAEVEAALQRIRDGTYGRCELTGGRISAARLRAIPWTRVARGAAGGSGERKRGAPGGHRGQRRGASGQ